MRSVSPSIKIVALLARGDPLPPTELLTSELAGYYYKDEVDESIVHLVRAIAAGAACFSSSVVTQFLTPSPSPGWPALDTLTPTELELATLVADGLTNAQIAAKLHWTPQTVRNCTSRLCRKLGVNRLQLIARFPSELKRNQN